MLRLAMDGTADTRVHNTRLTMIVGGVEKQDERYEKEEDEEKEEAETSEG